MKIQILLLLLFTIAFGKQTNAIVYITFSNEKITVSGDGASVSGTTVTIEKSGTYFVQGSTDEGNLIVTKGSVVLYLQHLDLSSKTTAPITVNSKLDDVKIINIQIIDFIYFFIYDIIIIFLGASIYMIKKQFGIEYVHNILYDEFVNEF